MPMYYFHLHDNEKIDDVDGTILVDEAAARDHAAGVARELTFKNSGMLGKDWSDWKMSVHNDQGTKLFTLAMEDFRNGNSK